MRQQLGKAAVWLAGQACEDVLQIGEGLVAIEACGLDETHDRCGTLAGTKRAGKQPVLATERDRPDLVLYPVVVDGHAPVIDVVRERGPALEAVIDGAASHARCYRPARLRRGRWPRSIPGKGGAPPCIPQTVHHAARFF